MAELCPCCGREAHNMKRYTCNYLSELGCVFSYVVCLNIDDAVVNFLDMVMKRHPSWSIDAKKVCTDNDGLIAYAYGDTWCLQVLNTGWHWKRLSIPQEVVWGSGKSSLDKEP